MCVCECSHGPNGELQHLLVQVVVVVVEARLIIRTGQIVFLIHYLASSNRISE